ncbi:MAG: viral A-type inclusion protein [Chitinophagaceae bacterium]|nr:viral A-type inclusion protein [Chitinophagaceae bacterium]
MKRIPLNIIAAILLVVAISCNSNKQSPEAGPENLQSKADSLEKDVIEGHDVAMPKSMKIPDLQKEAKRLIDSIAKLPAKAQEATAPYKAKLEALVKDLEYASMAMDKWMTEYSFDSARDNLEQRIKYLTEEKGKVDKVKEAVLGSIAKADSLLKAKL